MCFAPLYLESYGHALANERGRSLGTHACLSPRSRPDSEVCARRLRGRVVHSCAFFARVVAFQRVFCCGLFLLDLSFIKLYAETLCGGGARACSDVLGSPLSRFSRTDMKESGHRVSVLAFACVRVCGLGNKDQHARHPRHFPRHYSSAGRMSDAQASAPSAAEPAPLVGRHVIVRGLAKRPELNGLCAFTEKVDPKTGRYATRLPMLAHPILLKQESLEIAPSATAAISAAAADEHRDEVKERVRAAACLAPST